LCARGSAGPSRRLQRRRRVCRRAVAVRPDRYVGIGLMCGTLPFDAGVAPPPGRLLRKEGFLAHRSDDATIPNELLSIELRAISQRNREHMCARFGTTAAAVYHPQCLQTLPDG